MRQPLRSALLHDHGGDGLLEMALLFPLLLVVVFNAVNIGYFFSVCLNLATAPRQGVAYSIQGTTSALQITVPSADSVSSLVYENLAGAVPSAANAPTRVCTGALGLTGSGSSQVPNCVNYGNGVGTFSGLQPAPEAPNFELNRVDIQYTVAPLVDLPFDIFGHSLTVHRSVVMRAMP